MSKSPSTRDQIAELMQEMSADQPVIIKEFNSIMKTDIAKFKKTIQGLKSRTIPTTAMDVQFEQLINVLDQLDTWADQMEAHLVPKE